VCRWLILIAVVVFSGRKVAEKYANIKLKYRDSEVVTMSGTMPNYQKVFWKQTPPGGTLGVLSCWGGE